VTSSWFFLSTLNYDARSTTHMKYCLFWVITPASEFRRRGITLKKENKNKLIINISVEEGPYSEDISNSGRRRTEFCYWNHKIMPLYISQTYSVHSFALHWTRHQNVLFILCYQNCKYLYYLYEAFYIRCQSY